MTHFVPGNPDIYYGARPEQLDRQVCDVLSGHIIPSTQDDLPIVPNFFLAKDPEGSLAVAGRQACYDGALGQGVCTVYSHTAKKNAIDCRTYRKERKIQGGRRL